MEVNIDGQGRGTIDTGNGMLDHLLAQVSRHGLFDLEIAAQGDVQVGWHHVTEDVAIAMGRALREAAGDARGINRMASAHVPLDEALARVVVDFSGRGYAAVDLDIGDADMGGLSGDLVSHFLETLAREGGFNVHAHLLSGTNNHHKAEAVFKALARALRAALDVDPRRTDQVPSTKGTLR